MQRAADLLVSFSKTYGAENADFSCNPIRNTRQPQGILGLYANDRIRLLCHFVEEPIGLAQITMIATPRDEYDAGEVLLQIVKDAENLVLELDSLSPKWRLAAQYYNM